MLLEGVEGGEHWCLNSGKKNNGEKQWRRREDNDVEGGGEGMEYDDVGEGICGVCLCVYP